MSKTILLIEDNPEMRENTAEILELSNFKVFTAENGKVGVDLAKSKKPDLIICDIMMPELDGYGVLHVLSKSEETSSIPFIFLTAKAEKSDYRKGMSMGADDYLTKPFDDMELLNAVEIRLKKTELLKKDFEKNAKGFNDFMEEVKSLDGHNAITNPKNQKSFKKKETLFSEGNYPSGLYLINNGKVKTVRTNENGKELITGVHGEGDFIGYIALLEEAPYTESAIALEDTEVSIVPKQDFQTLIYSNKEIAKKFIKILSNSVLEKEERLIKLAYNSVRKRVAEALVMLYDRYQKNTTVPTAISISREDLSNIVGTATESAIRMLADFKEEKLITINKGEITVLNIDKLRKLKN